MPRTPFTRKNALVGYATSRIVLPWLRRYMKRRARSAATGAAKSSVSAARRHPQSTGLMLGALAGGVAWVASRNRSNDVEGSIRSETEPGSAALPRNSPGSDRR